MAAALVLVAAPALALAPPPPPDVPRTAGFVVDGSTVIPDDVEARIETRLRAHQRRTTNEILVMTIPTTGGIAIEPFAKQVFNTLGIGRKDRNNGVLILLAMQDRKLRIQVGLGLEKTITNAEAKVIVDGRMVPALKAEDPGRAVKAGVEGVLAELGDPAPLADDPPPQDAVPGEFGVGGDGLPAGPSADFRGLSAAGTFDTVFPVFMLGFLGIAVMAIRKAFSSGGSDGAGYGQGVWFGRHNTSWNDSPSQTVPYGGADAVGGGGSFGGGSSGGGGGGSTGGGGASGSW